MAAALAACGGGDSAATAERTCTDAAANGTVGYDTSGLVRAKRTTAAGFAAWMDVRNGRDSPRPVPTELEGDPAAPVTLCVYRADDLAPPGPLGRPPATGVSLILTGAGAARLEAMGDADRLAAQLDNLN